MFLRPILFTLLTLALLLAAPSAASAQTSGCGAQIQGSVSSLVTQGEQQVVDMICKVHKQIYKMVDNIKKIGDSRGASSSASQDSVSTVTKVLAAIALLCFSFSLIVISLQVFEVIVRLAVYTALAPFIIYCFIYPNTRHIFDNAVKGYIYATLKFSLLGAFMAAGLMIAKLTSDAVGNLASTINNMSTLTSSTDLAQAISYAGIAMVTGLMISRVMSAASATAAGLAAYAYANLGVAAGGMIGLTTFVRTAIPGLGGLGILGVVTGGKLAGSALKVGRVLGTAGTRRMGLSERGENIAGLISQAGVAAAAGLIVKKAFDKGSDASSENHPTNDQQ
jgi:hypothetical protein